MMGNIKYVLNAILVTVSQEFHVESYFLARYSDIFLIEKSIKWHMYWLIAVYRGIYIWLQPIRLALCVEWNYVLFIHKIPCISSSLLNYLIQHVQALFTLYHLLFAWSQTIGQTSEASKQNNVSSNLDR